jgi:uncharacterized protein (TIGR00299 family) protein
MKTLYLDCSMGAAGDMLAGALLELMPDPAAVVRTLNGFGIPDVEFACERTVKCGIAATHLSVKVHGHEEHEHAHDAHHHHKHRTLAEVLHAVHHLNLPDAVKTHVAKVYEDLAAAESRAHGRSVGEIHFHEVGAADAIADISAVCWLMDALKVDEVVASPVHVGSGTVKCAHGEMPVPAPATAFLLEGVPTYSDGTIAGELCTPTGAALLRHFVGEFGQMKPMTPTKIGCGAGGKDLEGRANIVRAMLGETEEKAGQDVVCEFRCAIDDMTAEDLAFAAERVMAEGALDAVMVPALMKKGRPGTLLEVLCRPDDRDKIARCIFRHTTTIGLRETLAPRRVLARHEEDIETPIGIVRRKVSEGEGVCRIKAEHDDLAAAAMKMTAEDGVRN